MSAFLAAALSLPTVFFTVLLGFFIVYSIFALIGALDIEWLDGLVGLDDANVSAGDGLLGVAGIPVTIVGASASLFAWVTSMTGMLMLPQTTLSKIAVGIVSALVGIGVGSQVVRPLRRLFVAAEGPHRRDFIGKIATIRSVHVGEASGTAEVGDFIAEVRCFRENELTVGSKAIIYDYDAGDGVFHVGPIADSIADVDKALELSAHSSQLAGPHPES